MLLDINVGSGLWVTFGTPLLVRQFDNPALNQALHRILLEREGRHPEMRTGQLNRSNLGGWRSEPDLLTWPEPEIATLKEMIHAGLSQVMQLAGGGQQVQIRADFNLVAWANINRRTSYNVSHTHPGNHWSGVYYVSTGKLDPGRPMNGLIEFQDPRPGAGAAPIPGFEFGHRQTIEPKPGLMLVFPSWHVHMVHPFFGDGERISIAFNLALHEFEIMPPAAATAAKTPPKAGPA
jgi:uncharacterized protein (TIGR02466 family)